MAQVSVPTGPPAEALAIARSEQAESDESPRTVTPFESAEDKPLQPADGAVPVAFSALRQLATATSLRKYLLLATVLVAAAVVIWLGVRAANPPTARTPRSAAAAPASSAMTASAMTAPNARRDPLPAAAAASVPEPVAATGTPPPGASAPAPRTPPPGASAPAPRAAAAPATGERFEILVASFRTDGRAASVANEVTELGLPSRRRVSEGWQQVLSGPFASRAQAEEAQRRLDRAGLTRTQIVLAGR
jgi:cell division protein FtsN